MADLIVEIAIAVCCGCEDGAECCDCEDCSDCCFCFDCCCGNDEDSCCDCDCCGPNHCLCFSKECCLCPDDNCCESHPKCKTFWDSCCDMFFWSCCVGNGRLRNHSGNADGGTVITEEPVGAADYTQFQDEAEIQEPIVHQPW